MFELQVQPIDQWPREYTRRRKATTFTQAYDTVMSDCGHELEKLGAKSAVLLMALQEHEIRIDGRPRAGAKPAHPGVILVATTRQMGTLRFPCDTYTDWLANLRAITLHLKALRAIDRYGVSVDREQYTGWKALPAPDAGLTSRQQAAEFIAGLVGLALQAVFQNPEHAIILAEKKTHPDKGGDAAQFHRVQQARRLLLSSAPAGV